MMTMFWLIACFQAPADSAGGSTSWATEGGLYVVEFFTDPYPLVTGPVRIEASVPSASSPEFDAVMESMGHGLSEAPVIEGGDGQWSIDCVLSMSGTWRFQFTVDGEAGADFASGTVEVG